MRASTPSNAAELCVPDQQELTMLCNNLYDRLKIAAKAAVAARNMTLLHHKKRLQLRNPQMQIEESRMLLAHLSDRMQAFVREQHLRERNRFSKAVAYLDACNPIKVLARGYSIVSDETKQIIRDGECLEQGDCVTIQFHRNKARCTVTEIIKDEE